MGHLIIIANEVVTRCEQSNLLSSYLKANLTEETIQKWETFKINKLDEINAMQQIALVSFSKKFSMHYYKN